MIYRDGFWVEAIGNPFELPGEDDNGISCPDCKAGVIVTVTAAEEHRDTPARLLVARRVELESDGDEMEDDGHTCGPSHQEVIEYLWDNHYRFESWPLSAEQLAA
jgi:hypothetical protein